MSFNNRGEKVDHFFNSSGFIDEDEETVNQNWNHFFEFSYDQYVLNAANPVFITYLGRTDESTIQVPAVEYWNGKYYMAGLINLVNRSPNMRDSAYDVVVSGSAVRDDAISSDWKPLAQSFTLGSDPPAGGNTITHLRVLNNTLFAFGGVTISSDAEGIPGNVRCVVYRLLVDKWVPVLFSLAVSGSNNILIETVASSTGSTILIGGRYAPTGNAAIPVSYVRALPNGTYPSAAQLESQTITTFAPILRLR